ncbi:MAG: plasmid stabilization protein [Deltaproteobacteria bacterium CG11_big_fil_rev_8_21_14_0_20_49_13]|nr:MAG: plasmid stabilization protein [Deltaproteobacteria bacterium CG11_big_fil_rev_8_21_14_0_20_49_13]
MTTKIKIIKTSEDYNDALELIKELMNKNPDPESEDGEKLSLLATLIQDYESKEFPESLPDPIDAILFRLEQQNLKPVDLIPFIGSRSKVSEILSRKRPLTISMIRSLEAGLGIPAKVLLKESDEFRDLENIVWGRFPLKEMQKRGYFDEKVTKRTDIKRLMSNFFGPTKSPECFLGMLSKTNYRSARPMDKHSLIAWSAFVVKKASKIQSPVVFKDGTVDLVFMQKLAQFSKEDDGPIIAIDFLNKHGIKLIIEPHFSQTYLDGATIVLDKKHPIIGLTIRHDRLDNFWFTLMHELAHIALHYDQESNFFYDNLDNTDLNSQEQEADKLAQEALIPQNKWENSPARLIPSAIAAESLAKELGIHTAIVAGRMRREGGRYVYLNNIITQSKVRQCFIKEKWSDK